jgi:hypothetical protein
MGLERLGCKSLERDWRTLGGRWAWNLAWNLARNLARNLAPNLAWNLARNLARLGTAQNVWNWAWSKWAIGSERLGCESLERNWRTLRGRWAWNLAWNLARNLARHLAWHLARLGWNVWAESSELSLE